MINIRFDNPYLLFLLIPLVLAVVVPFVIAVKKENKSRSTTIAIITHLVIVVLAVLAVAGMTNVAVITKTELYVLADVSYSTHADLDLIDSYIEELEDDLPRNSEMGVITFGKDVKLNTPLGEKFSTVRDSGTDPDATDIASALEYAHSLFSDSAIKRVVVYTDGVSTDPDAVGRLITVIETLKKDDVYVDFVYIDSSLKEGQDEVQISGVEFAKDVYKNKETSANVLINSNTSTNAVVHLMKDGELYKQRVVSLSSGYEVVSFELDTSAEGEVDYQVKVIVPDSVHEDTPVVNNVYDFTQTVHGVMNVLIITDQEDDVEYISSLYGDSAVIDAYVKPEQKKPTMSDTMPKPVEFDVPFTVEDLCRYDEIVLSNVDVRGINNAQTFIDSLNTVVSVFGKSLITAGNNNLQSGDDAVLESLTDMLPVKFGNSEDDPKLYCIVLDCSRSMEFQNFDFYRMAKLAAEHILTNLREQDSFILVQFWGKNGIVNVSHATEENIKTALETINGFEVQQGTMMGDALEVAYRAMAEQTSFGEKYMMLISDGMSYVGASQGTDSPVDVAKQIYESGIILSTLNTGNTEGESNMKAIAAAGGGKYYFAKSSDDLTDNLFDEIKDDITETDVRVTTGVSIALPNDDAVDGIDSLPTVDGYVYARQKASAETVLTVNYITSSGKVKEVPLYAYWEYGNGRVATFTSDLGGELLGLWTEGSGHSFLLNLIKTNIPDERIDYPYTVTVDYDGKNTNIEIVPAVLNHKASMNVTVTLPDGSQRSEKLTFDSYRYFYEFETGMTGQYIVDVSYDWDTRSYSSRHIYDIVYSPEYDRFGSHPTPAILYTAVRDNGTVSEGRNPDLYVDESKLATYVMEFKIPFLAIAAALYIIDTVIRKLKWADIKSFFKRKRREVNK